MLRERSILFLLKIYFVMLFFYGILIKLTIWNPVLFDFKSFLPEIILIVIGIDLFTKKWKSLSGFYLFGALWFFCIIVINIVTIGLSEQTALYSFRDFYIPLFVAIFLSLYRFKKTNLDKFLKFLTILSAVYLIGGAVLGVVESLLGWEWASRFYTGYVFYGADAYSGVKISSDDGILRAPGLTGQSATFSFYALVAVFIIWSNRKTNILTKSLYTVLSIIIHLTTLNKTAIIGLVLILLFFLWKSVKSRNFKIISLVIFLALLMLCVLGINVFLRIFPSFGERLDLWSGVLADANPLEYLIPFRSFFYGAGGEGFTSVLDNTYLYLLLAGGGIGLVWVCLFAFKLVKNNVQSRSYGVLFECLFLFLILSAVTTNITQGRAYFAIYFLLSALFNQYKETKSVVVTDRKTLSEDNRVYFPEKEGNR